VSVISEQRLPISDNLRSNRHTPGRLAGGPTVNTRATLGLTAGALVLGLLAGRGLGAGHTGTKKVSGSGPTKIVSGVPIGYGHSKEGAASAALNYETALIAAGPKAYRAVVDLIAVPSSRSAITEEMQPGMDVINKQVGETAFVRSAVVAYQVKSYTQDTAEIEMWEVGVLAAPNQPLPQAGWTTTTLRVQWAGNDWRVSQAPRSSKGPTPQQPDQATATGNLIDTVGLFSGTQYAVVK
jgi:hypothetical protein